MSPALAAALALGAKHSLPVHSPEVLLDGSNLLVHLAPAPVVIRVATFTGFIRHDPSPWLRREVSLGTYLAGVGASVVPPCDEIAPGPHLVDGWWMTVWRHVPHDPTAVASVSELLPALDELHAALAGYPGELPLLGPATSDLDLALACCVDNDLLEPAASESIVARRAELLPLVSALPSQALHGDAHPRNVLVAVDGRLLWNDFEDSCAGSPLWDVAVLARRDESGAAAQVAVDRFGPAAYEAMLALRALQGDVWTVLHTARREGRIHRGTAASPTRT
ncbi:MAG TPA: aminoglycoside phosphotransferase family protein [Ilumatobacteraceae bacterium]|nr:aminoglycoside phosphotransferase family protein [Ilumatobacteraceae bacterium]